MDIENAAVMFGNFCVLVYCVCAEIRDRCQWKKAEAMLQRARENRPTLKELGFS